MSEKYNRLTILEKYTVKRKSYANAICDCGNTITTRLDSIKSGHTKSCGCMFKELLSSGSIRRKYTKPKTHYARWKSMIRRCENSNDKAYRYYGEKGISVCTEWRNYYDAFYNWVESNKLKTGLWEIDRIDSSKNYSPENCQIISKSENSVKAMTKRWGGE